MERSQELFISTSSLSISPGRLKTRSVPTGVTLTCISKNAPRPSTAAVAQYFRPSPQGLTFTFLNQPPPSTCLSQEGPTKSKPEESLLHNVTKCSWIPCSYLQPLNDLTLLSGTKWGDLGLWGERGMGYDQLSSTWVWQRGARPDSSLPYTSVT